ncbi:aconitase X [Pseudomonas chlororaphis]|uniref:cis-3-hydroxy-L-proline dehydratase n=1 Tax=Pseudomonas chlororaphis TaxID=587753 RepID=UPI00046E91B0|nr:aconitase X [Pseudomonas chlororaphis]
MTGLRLLVKSLVHGTAQGEVLFSDVPLSLWGGVDPYTSEVIDRHHPLSGELLAGKVLAIPSGRGSCSGSAVIMELLLNGKAPAALVFAEDEEILTLGALVAKEIFQTSIPVVCVGAHAFQRFESARSARIAGSLVEIDGAAATLEAVDTGTIRTDSIELSVRDQAMLDGQSGKACQVAMQIILQMARIQGAAKLIDVTQAHIDGCIYTGPASLRFARQLCEWGAKVAVPTSLNSVSVDQQRWRSQGVNPDLGEPASALAQAYVEMGCRPTFTCAPYLLDTAPTFGEQIVWAESNAVVYANSVLGARTMKYPDYLDICIALTGRAPLSGCHISENRSASVIVEVPEVTGFDESFYPLLGYHVGLIAGHRIPLVTGLDLHPVSQDDLKGFGAAFATTSSAPMFHIAGVTPEAMTLEDLLDESSPPEIARISLADLQHSWKKLNTADNRHVDIISLGNPHFSVDEFKKLAGLCAGKVKHSQVSMIITSGRTVFSEAEEAGAIDVLRAFGAEFVTDTCWCMIEEPVLKPNARSLMTNSGKYAHYGPGISGFGVHYAGLRTCVETACTGLAPAYAPAWIRS